MPITIKSTSSVYKELKIVQLVEWRLLISARGVVFSLKVVEGRC
jgi:hypothetical protein